ncbi:SDR family oxidoreductase [Lysinibacillus sp. NPDC058147]|uniref:SDR family oxidoreductase n=1 Tax=unclassified Lysinibacillus TaxID=2636778 RepID=UPI0036D9BE9A
MRVNFYKSLLTNGAKVGIAGYSEKRQDVANTLGDESNIHFIKVDVSNKQQVKRAFAQKVIWFGQVDIVVIPSDTPIH